MSTRLIPPVHSVGFRRATSPEEERNVFPLLDHFEIAARERCEQRAAGTLAGKQPIMRLRDEQIGMIEPADVRTKQRELAPLDVNLHDQIAPSSIPLHKRPDSNTIDRSRGARVCLL